MEQKLTTEQCFGSEKLTDVRVHLLFVDCLLRVNVQHAKIQENQNGYWLLFFLLFHL